VGHFWDPPSIMGYPFMVKDDNGKTYMDFSPPRIFPDPKIKNVPEHGIFFIDEIVNAAPAVQSAWGTLILDRKTPVFEFPPGWLILCAGNRAGGVMGGDRASNPMNSALANRVTHLNVVPTLEDFNKYAEDTGKIALSVLAFVNQIGGNTNWLIKPPMIAGDPFPSPRSWEAVSETLGDTSLSYEEQYAEVRGQIGSGAALAFRVYMKIVHKLPNINDVLSGKVSLANCEHCKDPAVIGTVLFQIVAAVTQEPSADLVEQAFKAIKKIKDPDWHLMAVSAMWKSHAVNKLLIKNPEVEKLIEQFYPDLQEALKK